MKPLYFFKDTMLMIVLGIKIVVLKIRIILLDSTNTLFQLSFPS